jgi:hypothetical protein
VSSRKGKGESKKGVLGAKAFSVILREQDLAWREGLRGRIGCDRNFGIRAY